MHVDMDAFFAACELARRPELKGLPVIVGGQGRGVVLAATYEARAFGVHSALPMAHALRRCPQAVIVPPDHRLYSRVSDSIIDMFRQITDRVEQVSIDEAFMDLSGARRRLGPPTVIGAKLRAWVESVHGVTCSVGIAKNKFLAKLASTHAKPDGMLLVPENASVPFLRTLPVGALWGVGEKTEERLARWGIHTVAELADTDVPSLQAAVGKVTGQHLHNLAWGRDERRVVTSHRERSVSNENTFGADVRDPAVVEAQILALSDKVAGRLRAHGFVARTVSIKVRTSDFATFTRAKTLPQPSDTAADIYRAAQDLLPTVDLHGLAVRLVGVKAENLKEREGMPEQLTLDEAVSPTLRRDAELALDAVRDRFGSKSIALGSTHLARQNYDDDVPPFRR
jgi:DNA polymerase-4